MTVTRRISATLALVTALFSLLVIPAIAQEDGETPTETSQPAPGETIQPAVSITAQPADDAQLDWTYRYMIPTALVLGVLVIVATAGQYFVSVVRKRYRIVGK